MRDQICFKLANGTEMSVDVPLLVPQLEAGEGHTQPLHTQPLLFAIHEFGHSLGTGHLAPSYGQHPPISALVAGGVLPGSRRNREIHGRASYFARGREGYFAWEREG